MFKLVIQDDEGKTTVVPLIRDEITIGRKEGNTIRLTERNVSRRHARIVRTNGEVQIEDLGSYNGIRVNNARIAERVSLRISDQVQIGDYKLYLKAEGVEQVDDARTMPIERVGIDGAPATEVMAAVQQAPTAPIPSTPMPPAQRATMAVADTDPAGRPVATPAQVAALTTTTGYGKFVVLSSNFAGREFELTRPQMIVGRTDENDIVVNHRSISRNHAKITRDPETQRYTISDLQSSNGVRVNGQDYGKVELRRGDVVDLGHVRLRFVEPGEDFVFERDAVIADVPDAGGKKGLLVAIVLAIVVLGAIGAFFVFKGGGGGDKTGSNDIVGSNNVAVIHDGSDAQIPEHVGSNPTVVQNDIDANNDHTATNPDNAADLKRLNSECLSLVNERKWTDLGLCADKLAAFDKPTADQLKKKMREENAADIAKGKMEQELSNGSLKNARKLLDQIHDDSTYKKDAQSDYDTAEQKVVDDFHNRAQKAKHDGKCKDVETLVSQAGAVSSKAAQEARQFLCPAMDCTSKLVDANDKTCKRQFCATHEGVSPCAPIEKACDPEPMVQAGTNSEAMGAHAQALKQFEDAIHCKPGDPHTLALTFMAACNASNTAKAKIYWKKMSPDAQNQRLQMCVRNHITKEMLEAP